jgi:phosphoglycolate phosphatase-like HAD superfamily hydrolase
MAQTGYSQEHIWVIGDTVSDIDVARSVGAHALAVTWGWQSRVFLTRRAPEQLFDTTTDVKRYFLSALTEAS